MARLPLPKIKLPKIPGVQGGAVRSLLLERLAGGPLGRLLEPLTSLMINLGLRDRSNLFILNIGDEGATLVQVRGGEVVDAVFAEAAAEEGWDALRDVLKTDAYAQIVVVADVLEQMFREDTVPKVGILDRGKIVQRRLNLTFPNEKLKAALSYPRPPSAPHAVMFAALPTSAHLDRWLAFLDEFPNPLRGFYSLPLEAVGFAEQLVPSAAGEKRRVWRALISQEAASGFRQVFEARSKLMVTRLTQRPTQPLTAEAEAMLIERELRSSISYVKRLGFSDSDRLDVVILADPAVCRAIDERDLPATTVTAYTPYQAAVLLGLGEIGREDTPFADVLLGLWIAKKRRPRLALPSPRIVQQMWMSSIIRWSAATTGVLTLLAIYYVVSLATDYLASSAQISALETQLASAQGRLNTELDRMKNYPIPLDELTGVAETERRLTAEEIDVRKLMQKIAGALGNEGRVSAFHYELGHPPIETRRPGARPPDKAAPEQAADAFPYEIRLVVRLAPDGAANQDVQVALQRAKSILGRLSDSFPDLEVKATKLPGGVMVNQVLEGSAATEGKQPSAPVPTAEYVIRKAT